MHPPEVSIIVPCYNEVRTIRLMLDGIIAQSFPIENMEVVIADGMSTDLTRKEIMAFQDQHPELRVRIVDNPARNIPAALNQALRAAEGSFRMDQTKLSGIASLVSCVVHLPFWKILTSPRPFSLRL